MDVQKLKNAIEVLRSEADGGLIACDIWLTGTGQSIAGYNSQPKAAALFEKMTEFAIKALDSTGFPKLNKYYMVDLEGDNLAIVLQFKEGYQWGILVDSSKVSLGLLLNVSIPDARKAFLEALK
jgi:hypothetical protein